MSINKKIRKSQLRKHDPFIERESERYGTPLPSREFILQVLEEQGIPVSETKLRKLLDITPKETEFFNRRLAAMIRAGQIMLNRKGDICVIEKLELIRGTVQGHSDGYGFLITDNGGPDLYVSAKEMHKVLDGDRVIAREIGIDRRGRSECEIVEVLEHVNTHLIGRFYTECGIFFVVAENKRISQDILIPREATMKAKTGQVVMVQIVQQPDIHTKPIGHVLEILGEYTSPGMEIEIALRTHDLPYEFTSEIEKISAKFPKKVLKKELTKRKDIRHLPLVTIDGETARDFDDAVYCERDGKDYRLYVAIADVSHYVHDADALDQEAYKRGNSVYFPQRVIPMLPGVLSNGLCSLNPHTDRLSMVCEIQLATNGEYVDYLFYPAVMHSHARLTYNQVAAMLNKPKEPDTEPYTELLPHIQLLYKVYQILQKARKKRGAIDFETIETQMIFNDQGKIEQILPVQRNVAHRLIEECMLAANVCASDFLQKHRHPVLYRIHEGPAPEKLEALRDFLKEFGLQLGGGSEPHAKDFAKVLTKINGRADAQLLQTVMLRSLRQAIYSPENMGHFGLAYEAYTHFTSPIRRYPDLLVHRAIKAVLSSDTYSPSVGGWHELGKHCSMTERRADEATRDVESWLKCFYIQDKINDCFDGVISGVTAFGLFVALDQIYVEGLVHISELPSDYFHFDSTKHMLYGERTGKKYRLGDRLHVKLVRVDLETRKIDFVLA
ncbi:MULTISPECIES: ribonuclease R [Nitrosomonas]|uniref:Ribonuclease R n=1 Tax=Nitrosomonas communis TaxID=44574 RepID=A0A5D3YB73_9PROT|nr:MULTISPECIES: ribonuclease R [Nitrosomonas]TYP80176.1 ribonuclease R [Nitrosomonas communis]UVS61219.1 ribonuclease R [Nitrosomonas sp. PLL12]